MCICDAWNISTNILKYKYLQCKFRHVYMNFRQNFSQKKNISPFQEKTLAETVNCIPKGLRKGNPFHGAFAQPSYSKNIFSDLLQRLIK